MTSNRKMMLEEVLDEFFFSADRPTPTMVLSLCQEHPEYREDIIEFAALWTCHEVAPEPCAQALDPVSEESVSRLQSFVLNRLHELDGKPTPEQEAGAARVALSGLAGAKLSRATSAAGLGRSTLLLQKVLRGIIRNPPIGVMIRLARHLKVAIDALQPELGPGLAGSINYKSSERPNAPITETWESAVQSLPESDEEKARLLALQKEDSN